MSCTHVRTRRYTVVIIVIGGSYDRTIESMRVSSTLEIVPDNVSICQPSDTRLVYSRNIKHRLDRLSVTLLR